MGQAKAARRAKAAREMREGKIDGKKERRSLKELKQEALLIRVRVRVSIKEFKQEASLYLQ